MNKNYVLRFLTHPYNLYATSGATVATAVSVMATGKIGLLMAIAYAAVEVVAAMSVPFTAGWKTYIDRTDMITMRESNREHLLAKIGPYLGKDSRNNNRVRGYNENYARMMARINELYTIANDNNSKVSPTEVDRFNDVAVAYLSKILAWINIVNNDTVERATQAKERVDQLTAQIEANPMSRERVQWERARREYQDVLNRSETRASRRVALEATLDTTPDKIEEVYQLLSASPFDDHGDQVENTLKYLNLESDTEIFMNSEFSSEQIQQMLDANKTTTKVAATGTNNVRPLRKEAEGMKK